MRLRALVLLAISCSLSGNLSIGAPPAEHSSRSGFFRQPDYYLIAFKDHTVRRAVSYRIEGDTLYYISPEQMRQATREWNIPNGTPGPLSSIPEKRAPLATIDLRFTQQINRDRRVEFTLP
jgi:hypothetical protein